MQPLIPGKQASHLVPMDDSQKLVMQSISFGRTVAVINLGDAGGWPLGVGSGIKRRAVGWDINSKSMTEHHVGQGHALDLAPRGLRRTVHDSCATDSPHLNSLITVSTTMGKVLKVGQIVISPLAGGCLNNIESELELTKLVVTRTSCRWGRLHKSRKYLKSTQ
ncbi:hypothetical protein LP414_19855 [Polaromonas sp. P1(28)-13]|nr:hypothetical protein LP414_19855 [Polaromonas sp. P1(28)-13]